MGSNHPTSKASFEDPESPPWLYNREEDPEDLWFLPDPGTALEDHEMPIPRARANPLLRPKDWIAAQGTHAVHLARAAFAVGQLDMALAGIGPQAGQGVLERLALREAEALSWAAGVPVPVEEIGRDQLQARAATDLEGLKLARWAVRRLTTDAPLDDLRRFLGLHRQDRSDLPSHLLPRLSGEMFDEAAAEFLAAIADLSKAHDFTRAAFARNLWHLSDLSPDTGQIEGAVWVARVMAQSCQTLRFVPLGQGTRSLQKSNVEGFGHFLRAVEQGAVTARHGLQRLAFWRDRAKEQTAVIKGNNPARIIDALLAKPMATTEMIEQGAGVSRATAERLLARMLKMGLIREVTGANRFRIWAAKI